jgi:hypothetical protein
MTQQNLATPGKSQEDDLQPTELIKASSYRRDLARCNSAITVKRVISSTRQKRQHWRNWRCGHQTDQPLLRRTLVDKSAPFFSWTQKWTIFLRNRSFSRISESSQNILNLGRTPYRLQSMLIFPVISYISKLSPYLLFSLILKPIYLPSHAFYTSHKINLYIITC